MTAEDIAQSIIKSGKLVGGRHRYRNVTSIVSGAVHHAAAEPVNFKCPSWPGGNELSVYRAAAKKLSALARNGEIPFHVPASEILKAVECRISEILYYTGFYPEKVWGLNPNPLPVWKKIGLAALLFPEDVFPASLIRDIQNERNIVEHQFAEPDRNNIDKMTQIMNLFLDRTERFTDVLKQVSLMHYAVEDMDSIWRVQICRDDGLVVLFCGEYSANSAFKIQTIKHISKKPDFCTLLIQRVLSDIDKMEADPWSFFHLGEIMPDNLGPDAAEGEEL